MAANKIDIQDTAFGFRVVEAFVEGMQLRQKSIAELTLLECAKDLLKSKKVGLSASSRYGYSMATAVFASAVTSLMIQYNDIKMKIPKT